MSYGEEFTDTTYCWCSKVENQCQRLKSGEIHFNRKLMKSWAATIYNSLVRLITQVDFHPKTKQKTR